MKNIILATALGAALLATSQGAHAKVQVQGSYEVTCVNTTKNKITVRVDLEGDIESIKPGGDKIIFLPAMNAKTGKPSVKSFRTSYLLNKVTVSYGTKSFTYHIPDKPGINKDLRGKDWIFEFIQEGNNIKVCRKWAHTAMQGQATLASEVIGIITGAVALGAAIGAGVAASSGGAAASSAGAAAAGELGIEMATLGASASSAAEATMIGGEAFYTVSLADAAIPTVTAVDTGLSAGVAATVAAVPLTVVTVLGALDAAARDTQSTIKVTWKKAKKSFSRAFGLSRKLHNAGCDYLR